MTTPHTRSTGLLCLAVTSLGWGLNWPAMKFLLKEWPPLFARGTSGLCAVSARIERQGLGGHGVLAAAFSLGEALGVKELLAMGLTFAGVALALRASKP